jgi:cyclophilin family peptidyl-prolyl cis-trans isomerase
MRRTSLQSCRTCVRHVLAGWHRTRFLFRILAIGALGLLAATTSAAQVGTVVRFDLNYSVENKSNPFETDPLDYFYVELFDTKAPITCANFLRYVNGGLYDNTIYHRSVSEFVVQGGGFTPKVEGGETTALSPITSYGPIKNEFSSSRSNVTGMIAMAKVGDDPNSATNQWFVNMGDNAANLDNQNGGFTVFGQVLGNGMNLFKAINGLTTSDLSDRFGSAFNEVPTFNNGASLVTIKKATVVPPTGKLSGFVYVDTNGNGVMDGEDYAVADAKIVLRKAGGAATLATVYSGSDGSYQFSNVSIGTFSIVMDTPSTTSVLDNGKSRAVVNKAGTIFGADFMGPVQQNIYGDIVMGEGYVGTNFNMAQSRYPTALLSARLLLNSSLGPSHTDNVVMPVGNVASVIASTESAADAASAVAAYSTQETAGDLIDASTSDVGAACCASSLSGDAAMAPVGAGDGFGDAAHAVAVPEPGSLVLLAVAAVLCVVCRRRVR